MTDVGTIATALATRLSAATGWRAFGYAPGQIVPPVIVVIPNRPAITYGATMDGENTLNLLAIVLLSAANDTAGQQGLDSAISSSGAKSINGAVQVDPTLGGAVEYAVVLQVTTYGLVEYSGQQYLGASFAVQCGCHL